MNEALTLSVVLSLSLLAAISSYGVESSSVSGSAVAHSPPEVVERLFHAVGSGNIEAAVALTAKFENVPEEPIAQYYRRVAKSTHEMKIVAHLQLSSVAVVVVREISGDSSRVDLDPAYLIRRQDGWHVLPRLTRFDRGFEFKESTLGAFRKLETWYRQQKPELVRLLMETARPAERD